MNHNHNKPTTAGITIGLPNSSNKGFDIKAGMIDNTNTYNPNNNLKFYDSKERYTTNLVVCQEILNNTTIENTQNAFNVTQDNIDFKTNVESKINTESINTNNTNQP